MKTIAYLIVILSFLAAAFLASLHPTMIDWPTFLPVIVGGVIGVVLIKRTEHAEARSGEKLARNREVLEVSLENIVKNLKAIDGRKEQVPTYEMRFEIDKLLRADLNNFADARDSMKHLFGLQDYADIMSSFAAGERYINRVWSASTDGYIDEVLAYVEKSLSQFEHAREEFQAAAAKAKAA